MTQPGTIHFRLRAGFTLVETVVTVALLAVLAAVVFPTVIQKASAGDPVKVQNDLASMRTALETFATDLKSGYPHDLASLTTRPIAGVTRLLDSTSVTAGESAAWNGPYFGAMLRAAGVDSIATGYSAYVMSFIERYDAANDVPEHDGTGRRMSAFVASNSLYAALEIHGLSEAQARIVNRTIDGPADNATGQHVDAAGRFRYAVSANGSVTAWFLAAPITKL